MTKQHVASIASTRPAEDNSPRYRALCSCGHRSARLPRHLAEAWAEQHLAYQQRVAAITGQDVPVAPAGGGEG